MTVRFASWRSAIHSPPRQGEGAPYEAMATAKRQMTLPRDGRDLLGLAAGDRIRPLVTGETAARGCHNLASALVMIEV